MRSYNPALIAYPGESAPEQKAEGDKLLQNISKNQAGFFEIQIMRKLYDTYCMHRYEVEIQNFS